MKYRLLLVITLLAAMCMLSSGLSAAEQDLAAYYKFDEGSGNVTQDSSGNDANGTIFNAKWVKTNGGYALDFNGVNAVVDCGNPASLDIRGPITLMAWVCPAGAQPANEPGILGKQFSSYLITYYMNRQVFFYINAGGNSTHGTDMPGTWSQIVATFDGKEMRVYANGELSGKNLSKASVINPGGHFNIGMVKGDTEAMDPAYQNTSAFKGLIDEVKVYNRALSAEEIKAQFNPKEVDVRNASLASACVPVKAAQSIKKGTVSVGIGKNGGVQVNNGKSFFVLDSAYSYPGKTIGWNALSENRRTGWKPLVRKVDANTLQATASSSRYSLKRKIQFRNGRVEISDTLTNTGKVPIGIMIAHDIVASEYMSNKRVGTTADTPMIFFGQKSGDFCFLAEDDIGRLQFESSVVANTGRVNHSSFALDTGKSYTFRYAIYTLKPTGDVYNLINRVRRDWKVNFTIPGPCEFFDLGPRSIISDRDKLKKYLARKPLKIIMLSPWLEYDPGDMDHVITRDEYKAMVTSGARTLRELSPGIKVIGCIETDWVTLFPEKIKNDRALYTGGPDEFTKAVEAARVPWLDSVKRNKNGYMTPERYMRGGKPQVALAVYPAPGNYQHEFLLDQAKFIMDDCGLDGFYIDEFSQAWSQSIRDYSRWDHSTVDINPDTGEIMSKYTNCSLVGIQSRVDLINAALKRGKIIVTNTYSTSQKEQPLQAYRFWEMQAFLDISVVQPGVKPPLVYELTEGLLGSNIGLGVFESPDKPDLAEGLMLGLISYLRHGLVYYHYSYSNLPETGFGSGEYGLVNHWFPFTPLELHEGWMKGKERIVAACSFETDWQKPGTPKVLLFDLHGRQVPSAGKAQITGKNGKWHIKVKMNDWAEVLVVE